MFRILLIVIFFSFSLVNFSKANFDVKARTAILQDYHSGEILFEKEPDISIYPASACIQYMQYRTTISRVNFYCGMQPTSSCASYEKRYIHI